MPLLIYLSQCVYRGFFLKKNFVKLKVKPKSMGKHFSRKHRCCRRKNSTEALMFLYVRRLLAYWFRFRKANGREKKRRKWKLINYLALHADENIPQRCVEVLSKVFEDLWSLHCLHSIGLWKNERNEVNFQY